MARTKTRKRPRSVRVSRPAAIVVAAPRRSPARRRSVPRRLARSAPRRSGAMGGLMRKGVIAIAVGMAEREGYLARVPEIGQLGTIGSLGALAWAARRFGGVNMPILDDVVEVCVVTAGIKLGREGLTGGGGSAAGTRVSGPDEFAVEGEDF